MVFVDARGRRQLAGGGLVSGAGGPSVGVASQLPQTSRRAAPVLRSGPRLDLLLLHKVYDEVTPTGLWACFSHDWTSLTALMPRTSAPR